MPRIQIVKEPPPVLKNGRNSQAAKPFWEIVKPDKLATAPNFSSKFYDSNF